ncbi:MAG: calcineurin-like phosphoesterase C-terminal domain-containing protein [Hyphomicrobium sp.]
MSDDTAFRPTRRATLAAFGGAAAALHLPRSFAEPAQDIARGVVFEDRSCSGQRRRGDPGLAGVMLSNGRDVVLTDDDGRWSLPLARGDSAFVIKPPHWSTGPAAGIPSFSYRRGADNVPLPASIDFPLHRQPEPSRFEALLFADTQAATAAELDYVHRDLMRSATGCNAAFALHHGDVMGDDLSLLAPYRNILAQTGLTWHHCPGNHDLDLDAGNPDLGFESWKRHIGPTHYAFQYAGAVVFLLNNVEFLGCHGAAPDGRRYQGCFGSRQLAFVENVLRHVPDDALVVVSMHIPLVSFDAPSSVSDTTADRRELLRILARRPHTISFAGHSHTSEHHELGRAHGFEREAPHRHQVLTAASGSWWSGPPDADGLPIADSRDGSPRGYHVLSVDGASAATRFVPLSSRAPGQMRAMLQSRDAPGRVRRGPLPRAALANMALLVNAFDGGPETRVTFEVAGRDSPPAEMSPTTTLDPHIVESYARDRALCKPWVAAAPSSHIWSAPLPPDLAIGAHEIVVRVTGEYGAQHDARLTIEVVA